MTSNKIFKQLIPMVLAGAMMLVLAMPMTANAKDWDHHDNGHHNGWVHRDRDDFHHNGWIDHDRNYFRPAPRAYYPNRNYDYAPAYGRGYGYGGGCNMTRLQNVYRQDRATGHPAAANDVARQMRACGGVASVYPRLGSFLGW